VGKGESLGVASEKEAVAPQEQQRGFLEAVLSLIFLAICVPITVPVAATKFCVRKLWEWILHAILLVWSAFCVLTLILAAISVYVPVLGEKLSWFFLLPSKVNSIPQQPFVKLAIDILSARRV